MKKEHFMGTTEVTSSKLVHKYIQQKRMIRQGNRIMRLVCFYGMSTLTTLEYHSEFSLN